MKNKWMLKSLLLISLVGFASAQSMQDVVNALARAAQAAKEPPLKINSKYKAAHAAAHRLEFSVKGDSDSCSSVAIGPHALLTAAHCQEPTAKVVVDGTTYHIIHSLYDDCDHAILLLEGEPFTDLAIIDPTEPAVGDQLYYFGNPNNYKDILRLGPYVGRFIDDDGVHWVLDTRTGTGDSGAGVYNSADNLVSVMSQMLTNDSWLMGSMFELKFTQAQLDEATKF